MLMWVFVLFVQVFPRFDFRMLLLIILEEKQRFWYWLLIKDINISATIWKLWVVVGSGGGGGEGVREEMGVFVVERKEGWMKKEEGEDDVERWVKCQV